MLDEIFSLFKTQQDAQGRTLLERYLHPNNRWSHDRQETVQQYLTDKFKQITSVYDLEAIEIFSYWSDLEIRTRCGGYRVEEFSEAIIDFQKGEAGFT